MPAPVRPGLLMWAWLLVAACALLAAGWRWQELQGQRAVLAEQAALLSRMAPPEKAAAAPNSAELQRRAAAVAAQLSPSKGEDWASRWLAVEQALPAGLQLQAMEMEGASLRLEGLAPQADLVMQLVDSLATQAVSHQSAASEVVLTRLQRPEGTAEAAESNLLRFEVVRRRANGLRS